MPSNDRRAAARRRAWGRGPIILKLDQLEGRQLLTAHSQPLPDLVASSFTTVHTGDWGDSLTATGTILNQGSATATGGFNVAIYASTTPEINRNSVKIGQVSLPGGLAPGQSSAFKQEISLPSSAIPGFGTSPNGVVYLTLWVDPQRIIREGNRHNNEDLGAPYDTSPVQITAAQPSDLVGTSLSVTPQQAGWGDTVQLYTQIRNGAQGDAPATVARVVLTPAGAKYGTGQDVTVGTFPVPAIAAWHSVNLVQTITLPKLPPTQLAASNDFTLTVVPDSTFVTQPIFPGYAPQGAGLDQTAIKINPVAGTNVNMTGTLALGSAAVTGLSDTSSLVIGQIVQGVGVPAGAAVASINSASQVTLSQPAQVSGATALNFLPNPSAPTRGPLPDLASTTMTVPTTPLAWGRSFNVSTEIQNIGQGNAGSFNIVYMLVGASGSLSNGIVLADVPISGLDAGASTQLTQTLQLPARVPNGLTLDAVGVGKIAMVIDPENAVDEVTKNDNLSISGPVTLRLLGTDGSTSVPTSPAITLTQTVANTTPASKKGQRHPHIRVVHTPKKIHRRPKDNSIDFASIGHNLTVFPKRVEDLVKNIFK